MAEENRGTMDVNWVNARWSCAPQNAGLLDKAVMAVAPLAQAHGARANRGLWRGKGPRRVPGPSGALLS